MRVLVCGGRDFIYLRMMVRALDALHAEYTFTSLIHGDAPGADQFSAHWARMRQFTREQIKAFPADWKRYGRAAGSLRNQQMLDEGKPALVVAFGGGHGTAHMVRIARSAGVKVLEVSIDGTITGK